ncbi:MAG: hypothetical protein JMN24_00425 [gamma proteobacterium endosymbiont of Lamellibrachia anaximandri]|nr:hypothetical protein [gamma proteobacterium endosymbiont of Lamellibrachia anaximandri]MBL3618178.1 hypothetical protein [gamma proteobacterium endosymbiont of Lamellibrachia anaximandri]
MAMGSKWLQKGQSLTWLTPSTAVPAGLERMDVINPFHPGCDPGYDWSILRMICITADCFTGYSACLNARKRNEKRGQDNMASSIILFSVNWMLFEPCG